MGENAEDEEKVAAEEVESVKEQKVVKKRVRKPKDPNASAATKSTPKASKDKEKEGPPPSKKKRVRKKDAEKDPMVEESILPNTDQPQMAVDTPAAPIPLAPPPVTAPIAPEEEEDEPDDDVVAKPSETIGREETKALLDTFDDITLSRYEVFRRAHLPKVPMKKMISNFVGPVPASVAIVVSGVAKVFVGEMVESALEVMDECGDTGPITPAHLREAFRRYQKKAGLENRLYNKQVFE